MKRLSIFGIAAVIAVAVMATMAHASGWVVTNGGQHKCEDAARTKWPTPYKLEQEARKMGLFDDMKITRYSDGSVGMVAIHIRFPDGGKTTILYMHDMVLCASFMDKAAGGKAELD